MHSVEFIAAHTMEALRKVSQPRYLTSTLDPASLHRSIDNITAHGRHLTIATTITPDQTGRALFFMRTEAKGQLTRICQRCLNPFATGIDLRIDWQVVLAITPAIEPEPGFELIAESDYQGIEDLFIQEIMLAIPHIPLHPPAKCAPRVPPLIDNGDPGAELADNRFAVLAALTQTSGEN